MPHQRRKSGHHSGNTSMTDVRKTVVASDNRYKRPTMSRRQTPVNAQMLGRSARDREREREWHESWEDERESFPQFWYVCLVIVESSATLTPVFMAGAVPDASASLTRRGDSNSQRPGLLTHLHSMTCEKQFVPRDEKFLYCSESYVLPSLAPT